MNDSPILKKEKLSRSVWRSIWNSAFKFFQGGSIQIIHPDGASSFHGAASSNCAILEIKDNAFYKKLYWEGAYLLVKRMFVDFGHRLIYPNCSQR